MFDWNKWHNQMNHAEVIKNDISFNSKIKNINKYEYIEYLDLERRNDELLIKTKKNPIHKTRVTSKKYA